MRTAPIADVLLEAGLGREFRSISDPPVEAYIGKIGDAGVEVEFLTDAPGGNEGVVDVQDGLSAQSLHYMRLLYDNTWTVAIARPGVGEPLSVRVPTPAAFAVHKGIVYRKRRTEAKRCKDLFYMVHVLTAYEDVWSDWIEADLGALVDRYPTWLERMTRQLEADLPDSGSPLMRGIVKQRPVSYLEDLDDDQFAEYALASTQDFVASVRSLLSARS